MDELYDKHEIPAIMNVPQLGAFLGIGRNQAYELIRSGKVQALHVGRKIRVPRHAVLKFLGATAEQ